MKKYTYTFSQYCKIVDKNITLEETTYLNGNKHMRCLNHHKCKESGNGCKNAYILKRIEKAVENNVVE